MNNKHISKNIVYAIVAAFILSSFGLSNSNKVFALLGFYLIGTGEEDSSSTTTSQNSTSLQNARCYSPTGSIIDSCNSGDLSGTENTEYNVLGQ